jgi:hypothetical protein
MPNVMRHTLIVLLPLIIFGISYAGSSKDEYELSARCSNSSVEFVKEKYNDWAGAVTDYTSHYNRKLNKCFVLATFVYGGMRIGEIDRAMWDINENKRYGQFVPMIDHSRPLVCEILGRRCDSEAEWDSLVRPYMEE